MVEAGVGFLPLAVETEIAAGARRRRQVTGGVTGATEGIVAGGADQVTGGIGQTDHRTLTIRQVVTHFAVAVDTLQRLVAGDSIEVDAGHG